MDYMGTPFYEAIQQVAEQKSLMVIFDKANHSNLLYTNPKSDLSDQVLKKNETSGQPLRRRGVSSLGP